MVIGKTNNCLQLVLLVVVVAVVVVVVVVVVAILVLRNAHTIVDICCSCTLDYVHIRQCDANNHIPCQN
jgi:hypothetical protein